MTYFNLVFLREGLLRSPEGVGVRWVLRRALSSSAWRLVRLPSFWLRNLFIPGSHDEVDARRACTSSASTSNVLDMRSCHVSPSPSTSAQMNPRSSAEADTR